LVAEGQNSNHADQVLRQAEDAVARAKQAGRNCVEVIEIGGTKGPRPVRALGM
jgi:hypothetical protein